MMPTHAPILNHAEEEAVVAAGWPEGSEAVA
jgi:hypothetical protein